MTKRVHTKLDGILIPLMDRVDHLHDNLGYSLVGLLDRESLYFIIILVDVAKNCECSQFTRFIAYHKVLSLL